jgi:hypothetical protein
LKKVGRSGGINLGTLSWIHGAFGSPAGESGPWAFGSHIGESGPRQFELKTGESGAARGAAGGAGGAAAGEGAVGVDTSTN